MDARKPDCRCVQGLSAADRLVCAPGASWHDRGRSGRGDCPQRNPQLRASDEGGAKVRDGPADAVADCLRRPTPGRASDAPAPARCRLGRARVRLVILLPGRIQPQSPCTVARANAELDTAAAVPVEPHQVEAARGGRERSLALERNGLRPDRREPDGSEAGKREGGGDGYEGGEALRHGMSQGDGDRLPRQGLRPHPDRILTVVGMPRLRGFLLTAVVVALAVAGGAPAAAAPHRVLVASLEDDINPVSQHYLQQQVKRAERERYDALVVELDTSGGLGTSMRAIVKSFLAASVPVIVYVSPGGSSADSAGAVIGQAADVLAMAPQTNIGSSTPITTSGTDFSKDLRRKIVNDAAAYISELAREHGRNAAAAEAMVRDAANYGAREAAAKNIVDVVAPTLPSLLRQIDGTITQPKGLMLETAGASVDTVEMSFWQRILDTLIDPNIIALMLSLGVVGILVELGNPGLVLPGTVGVISLVVGLYGLQVLPVSAAGVLMLLVSLGLFVTDALVTSHGALTLAGAVTFVIGALMLFDPAGPAYQVSLWTALGIAGAIVLLFGVALSRIVKARRNPVEVGIGLLVGEAGEA